MLAGNHFKSSLVIAAIIWLTNISIILAIAEWNVCAKYGRNPSKTFTCAVKQHTSRIDYNSQSRSKLSKMISSIV